MGMEAMTIVVLVIELDLVTDGELEIGILQILVLVGLLLGDIRQTDVVTCIDEEMVAPFVADADRNRDINLVELRPVTQAHADSVVGIVLIGHHALPSCSGEVGSLYSGVQSQAFPDIEVGGNGNGQVICLDRSILELGQKHP